ncbi:MAG: type I restriction endonuclease, partial [Anaerolineae bacterium]
MVDVSEQNFEATIEQALLERGYHARRPQDYDKDLCLIPDDFFDFIFATQPEEWQIYQDQHGEAAKRRLLRRLGQQIDRRGTVEVLRRGLRDTGCRFQVAYFVPATGLNPELQRQYEANRFAVVRQLRYSQQDTGKSLDLAIFLNGLPIFTAELKNPLAGQTVENAIWQYRHQRDPRGEPLFDFERVLAHFAVDPDLVYFTTHLRGPETRFFPFNRGYGTGAGNPP